MPSPRSTPALPALALLAAACATPADHAAEADAEVAELLALTTEATLGGRQAWVRYPEALPVEPPPDVPGAPVQDAAPELGAPGEVAEDVHAEEHEDPGGGTARLVDEPSPAALPVDLEAALGIAVSTSRDYLSRREDVYLSGLDLTLQRFNFGPLLDSTISYLWADTEDLPASSAGGATFGVTEILDTGGTLGFDSSLLRAGSDPGSDTWASGVAFSLDQPLLRGAGYEVSHESLTQAERNVVYELRDFELFRESFSIDVARSYFDLVSRQKRIVNLEQNYQDAVFDRNKSEALRQVDRNQDEDVILARRQLIQAENDLLVARTNYRQAVEAFKIQLGLPVPTPVEILDAEPPYAPVRLDEDSAVAVALGNRLDLLTSLDRVEDAERAVRNARNGLLPDLDFSLGAGLGEIDDHLSDVAPEDWAATAGLELGLPLQRQAERNAYRSAQISLDRSRRDASLSLDNVEQDVRNQLRDLRQTEQQIELQLDQIAQSRRAVAITEIRYESGDADSRDLIESRTALVDAENELVDLQASHFIARLELKRSLGLLFIDEEGMWEA